MELQAGRRPWREKPDETKSRAMAREAGQYEELSDESWPSRLPSIIHTAEGADVHPKKKVPTPCTSCLPRQSEKQVSVYMKG